MTELPSAEQVHDVVHFIDARATETRDRVFALDEASDDDAEALHQLSTALHIAIVHTAGTLLYELTEATEPNARLSKVCWESLTRTAEQWATHPDYPTFLPTPEWAR